MAMTPRSKAIALSGLLMMLAGGLFVVLRHDSATTTPDSNTEAAVAVETAETEPIVNEAQSLSVESFDAAERDDALKTAAPPSKHLPGFERPVQDWLADLRQRAAHGDAAASCRLAAALQDCASQEPSFDPTRQAQRDTQRLLSFRGSDEDRALLAQSLQQQSAALLSRHQRCLGLGDDVMSLWPWYLLRAADAGYPDAMLTASDPFSYRPEMLLQQAGLAEALHGRIPGYLQRLIEQGSVRALGPLHWWLTEPRMLAQLGELPQGFQDPEIVLALTRRAEEEFELRFQIQLTVPGAASPWDSLSEQQRVRAEQLWQTYFGPGSEHRALLQYSPSELENLPMLPINPERRARSCAEPVTG